MRHLIIFSFCLSLFMSCNEESSNNSTNQQINQSTNLPPKSKFDEEGTKQLMIVISDYYELKDALVATDHIKADEAANKLKASAGNLKTFLNDSTLNYNALVDTIYQNTNSILSYKDKTTEIKRAYFEKVSDAMYELLKQTEIKNAGVYRQYCPMAFNDKGAYWLSNETKIRNPYFGKKMLSCGEVTDSLK